MSISVVNEKGLGVRLFLAKTRSVYLSVVFIVATLAFSLMGTAPVFAGTNGDAAIFSYPPAVTAETTAIFTFYAQYNHPGSATGECKLDSGAFAPCANTFTTPTLLSGVHIFTVHVVGETNPEATASYTWTVNQRPTLAGGTPVSGIPGEPIAITDLQVADDGNDSVTLFLSAPGGSLEMSTTTGLSFIGPPTGSGVAFMGARNAVNAALATLSYIPNTAGSSMIGAKILGVNDPAYNQVENLVFKVVNVPGGINWDDAKAAAEASTYGGENGYLATPVDLQQNDFINNQLSGSSAWIGASDSATEGEWKWVGGPLNNTSFWSGDASGSAVGGAYTNWQSGMPDNSSGTENCLEVYPGTAPSSAQWNDQDCNATRQAYVVEYGDGVLAPYADIKDIIITATNDADGDGLINSTENSAPNSGDANNDGTPDSQQANVSTQLNPVNGSYLAIQTSCTANINVMVGAESDSHKDTSYDYPAGLAGFIGTTCGTAGSSVTVTQYYYGDLDPDKLVLRKWDTAHDTYATISGAVLSAVTIGGQRAVKVVYQVVDGGPLDTDGVADGNINDPVGLGLAKNVTAPDTGIAPLSSLASYILVVSGALFLAAGFVNRRLYFRK